MSAVLRFDSGTAHSAQRPTNSCPEDRKGASASLLPSARDVPILRTPHPGPEQRTRLAIAEGRVQPRQSVAEVPGISPVPPRPSASLVKQPTCLRQDCFKPAQPPPQDLEEEIPFDGIADRPDRQHTGQDTSAEAKFLDLSSFEVMARVRNQPGQAKPLGVNGQQSRPGPSDLRQWNHGPQHPVRAIHAPRSHPRRTIALAELSTENAIAHNGRADSSGS